MLPGCRLYNGRWCLRLGYLLIYNCSGFVHGNRNNKRKTGKKQVIFYKNKKSMLSVSTLKIGPLPQTITYNSGTNTTGERIEASPLLHHCDVINSDKERGVGDVPQSAKLLPTSILTVTSYFYYLHFKNTFTLQK